MNISQTEAQKIIESLRMGIPPEDKISLLTFGRSSEIIRLKQILDNTSSKAFLINANYGCGKTHLLKFIKEEALSRGYAVSMITVDSNTNARFNRMDQIFGHICRNLQIKKNGEKGIRELFNAICDANNTKRDLGLLSKISNNNIWDKTEILKSPSMFIALRAWNFHNEHDELLDEVDDIIENWLCDPTNYYNERSYLYNRLVLIFNLKKYFCDPQPDWKFYKDKVFDFRPSNYKQCWDALSDLNLLTKVAGFKGLVILVDEYEDVIYNLNNKKYQLNAFENLFKFFSQNVVDLIFFSVTPNFVYKCKNLLLEKNISDYDHSKFEKLERFEISPLTSIELFEYAERIIEIYQIAYHRICNGDIKPEIKKICKRAEEIPVDSKVRLTVKDIVSFLDNIYNTSTS